MMEGAINRYIDPMSNSSPLPQLRFRLVLGRDIAVGPGKVDLLTAVATTGSIAAAGRSMGMSYKRAWYLLDTMNRCFKEPLVQATKGGKGHGGARLTPMGERVLALYRDIERLAAVAAAAELEAFAGLIAQDSSELSPAMKPRLAGADL